MKISVSQHIYSNVPKEQSPSKRRGYQTLFYTHDGLTREEVLILEDRAQYYGGETEPRKYQFHMLPDGKAVVSQTVPLDEPDEFGRKGRYLSHSLIVSAGDFRRTDYFPLTLFVQKIFLTELPEVFQKGDINTGNFPSEIVDAPDDWADTALEEARQWSSSDLEILARLGWQAGRLREERKSVGIWGDINSVFRVLAVVFLLTAPEKRPLLTFDTHALDCDWTREWPFWVWGGLDKNGRQTTFQIDAAARRVNASLDQQHDTAFENWIVKKAIPQRLEYYAVEQDDILRLTAFLDGAQQDLSAINDATGQQFARLNTDIIVRRVLNAFPQGLSSGIKSRIAANVSQKPWPYMQRLNRGFTQQEIAGRLYVVQMADLNKPVTKEDKKVIGELADQINHLPLQTVLLLRSGDRAGWQNKLSQLSDKDYAEVVWKALSAQAVSVSDAFCPEHIQSWLRFASEGMQPGELKTVLKLLKKDKDTFDLDQFASLLPHLHAEDKAALIKWLQSSKEPAPKLRARLQVPEPVSLVDRVKSLWSGSSKGRKKKSE